MTITLSSRRRSPPSSRRRSPPSSCASTGLTRASSGLTLASSGLTLASTLLDLAVSGSEHVPGELTTSGWNVSKSKAFLAKALEGYDEISGSDGEGEAGSKSRTARLKVIAVMGGNVKRVIGAP